MKRGSRDSFQKSLSKKPKWKKITCDPHIASSSQEVGWPGIQAGIFSLHCSLYYLQQYRCKNISFKFIVIAYHNNYY